MKIILALLILIATVSCSSAITPVTNESPTLITINTETSVSSQPTNTLTLVVPSPTLIVTLSPQSSTTQLQYPNHENCKIQVDTQKWELTEEGEKSIASSMPMPISNKLGVGGILFAKHKYYPSCNLSWITNGYREVAETSLETIDDKIWKVWGIETLSSKVYVWPELNEVQFVWVWTGLDVSEKESCQADIYEVLGSLQCE
jgi:hypothetical protein